MSNNRKYILDFIKKFNNALQNTIKNNQLLSFFIITIFIITYFYFLIIDNKIFKFFFTISLVIGSIGSMVLVKDKTDTTTIAYFIKECSWFSCLFFIITGYLLTLCSLIFEFITKHFVPS